MKRAVKCFYFAESTFCLLEAWCTDSKLKEIYDSLHVHDIST